MVGGITDGNEQMITKTKTKTNTNAVLLLDPWRVKPFAGQPRKRFRGIKQLAESIRLVGQVTPIVVTPIDEKGFDAELVDGERRLQACRSANIRVKAFLDMEVGQVSDLKRFALSIAANFCRQGHDCIEIAEACERLQAEGLTYEQIAAVFGKTNTFVAQHLSIRRLHPAVQDMLKVAGDEKKQSRHEIRRRGRMTLSLAMLLVPLDEALQLKAARQIVKQKLSMAAARNLIRRLAEKKNVQVGRRRSPYQHFSALWNQTDTYRFAVERYATMRHAELQRVFEQVDLRRARTLAGQLRALADDLTGIADALLRKAEKK